MAMGPRSAPRCDARSSRAAAAARTVSALKVVATDDGGSAEGGDAHGESSANAKGAATQMASIHHRRATCEL